MRIWIDEGRVDTKAMKAMRSGSMKVDVIQKRKKH